MADSRTVEFYYDFISPNAYLAWTQLPRLAERHHLDVAYRPVLFAALLDASGRRGPAEIASMRRWMLLNCLRKAESLGVPLAPPASHPFNPLLALRVAIEPDDEAERRRRSDALFHAVWAERSDVTDEPTVVRVLDAAGADGESAVRQAGTALGKQRLVRATEAAIERGVFGVPTIVVDGELFWGYDDFPQLDRHLCGESDVTRRTLDSWRSVRPSATRPGATGGGPGRPLH